MSDAIRPVVMPKWGLAMQEGMVARWLVEEGADIATGDEILDIETSKIANVFESPVAGTLRRRVVGEGETVPVGALLGVVADSSVPDTEVDGFVARFQEEFAAHAAEAAETGPEPATIEAGGRRLRYLEMGEGEGPPVLFIHGFGGDLYSWQFNQEALAEHHHTYALDLPGHGGSSKDLGGQADVGALAKAVLDFMDAKAIAKAHLVGHSLGGAIALDLALDHPDRVASATLVCSAALGPEINMAFIDGFMQGKRRKQLQPVLEMLVADPAMVSREMIEDVLKYKRLDGVEAALNRIAADVFAGGRQALQLAGRLGEASVPVQVIWGKRDQILPARHAEGVPGNVQVAVLDDAGHMVHMEKAAEVNDRLRAFIG